MFKASCLSLVTLLACKNDPAPAPDPGPSHAAIPKMDTAPARSAQPAASAAARIPAAGKGPVWDAFLAAHPEAKGLSTLLVGDNRKRVDFIGRANLPSSPLAAERDAEMGQPAYFALRSAGDFNELWFPSSTATFAYRGALVSLGEPAPRQVVASVRGSSGHGALLMVETPEKLVQGAYWIDGGFDPLVFQAIPTPDKKASLLVGFVTGSADAVIDYDLALFAFASGVFKPILTLPRGARPQWTSNTPHTAARAQEGAAPWAWASPLPEVRKAAGDQLVVTAFAPDGGVQNCGGEDYKQCKFIEQEYRYDAKAQRLVPSGAAVPVVRPLVAVKYPNVPN